MICSLLVTFPQGNNVSISVIIPMRHKQYAPLEQTLRSWAACTHVPFKEHLQLSQIFLEISKLMHKISINGMAGKAPSWASNEHLQHADVSQSTVCPTVILHVPSVSPAVHLLGPLQSQSHLLPQLEIFKRKKDTENKVRTPTRSALEKRKQCVIYVSLVQPD